VNRSCAGALGVRVLAWLVLAAAPPFADAADAADEARRRASLEALKVLEPTRKPRDGRINLQDITWEDWQRRTGELPPDFASMPSNPFLPDPLAGVRTRADWAKRREELKATLQHWMTGRLPPKPDNLRAVVTGERQEGDVTVRDVRLEFGPGHRATLRLQLLIPPGAKKRPVFLTNHNRSRPWAASAVARGYVGCIYHATDPYYGEGDDSEGFVDVYPDYDFSVLSRWAWAASRAVDYLVTLPEVEPTQIGLSGHSRNGKSSVFAAAFDERIAAVVASGGNTGECTPWRYTNDPFGSETAEIITTVNPHWFHPRLRFFIGNEDKLPFDQNTLFSLIAPRGVLMNSAFTESANTVLGFEQHFRSLRRVYEFLGARDHAQLRLRAGLHATTADDIETYFDFFDRIFGRGQAPVQETMIFGYTFEGWQRTTGTQRAPAVGADPLRWALGERPPQVPFARPTHDQGRVLVSDGWMRAISPAPVDKSFKEVTVPLGVNVKADLFLPVENSPGRRPVVIWLHAFNHARGYMHQARTPFVDLVRRGYAVLAFDQIGFGTRVEQAKDFYRRYPQWSLLGKMVADTRSAIAAMRDHPAIDPDRIYLVGYALGAQVALWTAAEDPAPRAVVAIAGITPLRTSGDREAIRMYSHLHGLLPRLGFYADRPAELPFDYDDVLRRIGGKPVLIVAPQNDRFAHLPALQALVRGLPGVTVQTPYDFNRLSKDVRTPAFEWLDRVRTQGP